ncbi:MAG: hypothetical protein OEW90_00245 [Betaproteobacteria bacterium]|nr:hypothetical protein [Betaproteobacteria bacterium]MDH4322546.1 hypothetical protein [Betaproteobacteria bacterium]
MIEFAPLFTLEVEHAYYGGRCPDFAFAIPAPSARLLAGGRLLAKTHEDCLTVLYEKDAGGAPLAPLGGATLQLGLRLANSHFSNFTALSFAPGEGLPLYRNAGADPAVLQAPVMLLLDPADAADARLLREEFFALVEIELRAAFYDTAPAFRVPFAARAETLSYYVVARGYTAGQFNQLDVSDAGFATDDRTQIHFERVASSAFTAAELPAALLGGAGTRVTLFRSQDPVARQQKARKGIQLTRNSEVIVPQLPQPGAAAATASLVVHVSKS